MRILLLLSVLAGMVACALAATCDYNGVIYNAGSTFNKNPCEHCYCPPGGGHVMCAIADCVPVCSNLVYDPTRCCPTCQVGGDCVHTDGTIIKAGETYHPDENTMCQCPTNTFSSGAMCVVKVVDPVDQVG